MPTAEMRASRHPITQLGLVPRIGIIATALIVETLLFSYLIQGTTGHSSTDVARVVHGIQHWTFRCVIAYSVSFAMLVYLRGPETLAAVSATAENTPMRIGWGVVHVVVLLPFAVLSAALYGDLLAWPFPLLAVLWHACGIAAVGALLAAMAPLPVWTNALRQTSTIAVYALLPAITAVAAIKASQLLWAPAAELTFHLAQMLLRPFVPSLLSDPATLTLATSHFGVTVSEECSGLEGMGLMLVFCTTWLWYFRREYYFPRALLVVPAGLALVFLLNAVRIAALVLIGDAGHERIAMLGFHSQAGWIAFNLAAFGVAIFARQSSWLNRGAAQPTVRAENATAAYLMPLLAILAAGMVAHALSAGWDSLYPLRLITAAGVLWAYKRSYRALDWRFSWRALVVGSLVFGVWALLAHFLTTAAPEPADLSRLPTPVRAAWICCRAAASMITVPIAEELAYRGFLMRRLVSQSFESIAFSNVRWPALGLSAVAFGITHGSLWLPGILAGLAYGLLAIRTGRIGESVAAHATTNALLVIDVLLFDQWQLW